MKLRILVVDDEKTITDLVGIYLRNEGYDVTLAYTGADAANLILTREFDLAILDVMLPDIDGFELLRTIRADHTYPVIMLTARSAPADKIEGLSLGADDYVVKPFRPLVLVARVKAQLRRYTSYGSRDEQTSRIISINGLEINPDAHSVTVDGKPVRCTPIEYSILLYLAENRGRASCPWRTCSARCGTRSSCRDRITRSWCISGTCVRKSVMTHRTRASSRTSGAWGTRSKGRGCAWTHGRTSLPRARRRIPIHLPPRRSGATSSSRSSSSSPQASYSP